MAPGVQSVICARYSCAFVERSVEETGVRGAFNMSKICVDSMQGETAETCARVFVELKCAARFVLLTLDTMVQPGLDT